MFMPAYLKLNTILAVPESLKYKEDRPLIMLESKGDNNGTLTAKAS